MPNFMHVIYFRNNNEGSIAAVPSVTPTPPPNSQTQPYESYAEAVSQGSPSRHQGGQFNLKDTQTNETM